MARDPANLKIFVSSTAEDLAAFRAVAQEVILELRGQPVMMEYFGASANRTVQACLDEVADCDVMLLLLAFRRGWQPPADRGSDGTKSITEIEVEFARARNIAVLPFLAKPDEWPGSRWETKDPTAMRQVEAFRTNLNQPAGFFGTEADPKLPAFRNTLKQALLRHAQTLVERRAPSAVNLLSAQQSLAAGRSIPFIGSDVYGSGALVTAALSAALRAPYAHDHDHDHDAGSLATTAEFVWRNQNDRVLFLQEFETVLDVASQRATPSPVHDLIAKQKKPPLIVSTSYDLLLEERLAEFRPVIVCHVVRSNEGLHDGKILVLRPGAAPELKLADKVIIGESEWVIYKPLGSPLLRRRFPAEFEELGLDTVVATETDHVAFLRLLTNEHSQIPTVFSRFFRRLAFLFIGYRLDVWQYRLVMHVFHAGNRRPNEGLGPIRAVRQPQSQMEALLWQRLGADLIPLEPDDFARRLLGHEATPAAASVAAAAVVATGP